MIIAIMPAYNEEKTIVDVIKRTKKYVDKLIVVNDASVDRTAALAAKAGAKVISHKVNRGLGGALRTGFEHVLESAKLTDIVITIDSDGQHNPEEIPKFVEKIEQGYDFILGARDLKMYPLRKRIGNTLLTTLTNLICKTSLADTESGFRAFRACALAKLDLHAERYQIAAEIIFEIGRNKLRSANVEIESPKYRSGVTVKQGVDNFIYVLKRKFSGQPQHGRQNCQSERKLRQTAD